MSVVYRKTVTAECGLAKKNYQRAGHKFRSYNWGLPKNCDSEIADLQLRINKFGKDLELR